MVISFALALTLALLLTPVVRSVATRLNILDYPNERKRHKKPTPRAGGVALFISIFAAGIISSWLLISGIEDYQFEYKSLFVLLAACLICFVGLWDDVKGLSPRYKLTAHVIAACLAIYGGVVISKITIPFAPYVMHLGLWGIPVTILWYLLIINGFNLIDGLDGLAAGVTLLVSLILLISLLPSDRGLVCVFLAAMIGATLGFLRYNFFPASIFMGDCGSYLMGFMLATLSIAGSVKGQAAVAILAPIVAMGLPLFDSIFSAIRRFFVGRSMFVADKEHLHHKLLTMGINHRRAVIIFYGITVCLGFLAIGIMQIHDARVALVFLILGLAIYLAVRKLGYFKFLGPNRMLTWWKDLYDDIGLPKDRRSFRGLMMDLAESQDLRVLWKIMVNSCAQIGVDFLRLTVQSQGESITWREASLLPARNIASLPRSAGIRTGKLSITLPICSHDQHVGELELSISLTSEKLKRHVLRRVEQLGRTLHYCNVVVDPAYLNSDQDFEHQLYSAQDKGGATVIKSIQIH